MTSIGLKVTEIAFEISDFLRKSKMVKLMVACLVFTSEINRSLLHNHEQNPQEIICNREKYIFISIKSRLMFGIDNNNTQEQTWGLIVYRKCLV